MQIYSISVPEPKRTQDGRKYLPLTWFTESDQYHIKRYFIAHKMHIPTIGNVSSVYYNDFLTFIKNTKQHGN